MQYICIDSIKIDQRKITHWSYQQNLNKWMVVVRISWVLALKVFTYLRKLYLCSTVGKTRLSSIVIINIERSFANRIFQVSMDRIIDILGKRKDRSDLYMF